jgi:hypothetical protein
MKQQLEVVAETYDDLSSYKAPEVHKEEANLCDFLDLELDESLVASKIKQITKKPVDPAFPEKWQQVIVNVETQEDYIELMKRLNRIPNLKSVVDETIIYTVTEQKVGIDNFFGDE